MSTNKRGQIYVASMNLRGKWAVKPNDEITVLNVTSAQSKTNKNRRDFSPMTECNYKGYYNFESFWQSGKVYKDIPEEITKKFWKKNKEAKRRYPGSKGKQVLYARWEGDDEKMDYVTSRKKVYVPLYHELMKTSEMISYWLNYVNAGNDIIIYDFDGPRTSDGSVTALKVTKKLLCDKINDTRFPFGHGYVIAAYLAGINISDIINGTEEIKETETKDNKTTLIKQVDISPCKKHCDSSKICNTKTGRCVLKSGKIGKEILAKSKSKKPKSSIKTNKKRSVKDPKKICEYIDMDNGEQCMRHKLKGKMFCEKHLIEYKKYKSTRKQ